MWDCGLWDTKSFLLKAKRQDSDFIKIIKRKDKKIKMKRLKREIILSSYLAFTNRYLRNYFFN